MLHQNVRKSMQRSMYIGTNNSARKAIMVCSDKVNDTGRITLTTEPSVYAKMMQKPSCKHNIDDVETEKLDSILRALSSDKAFLKKYSYSSLFLIGAGSFGYVFRVVSNAYGTQDKTAYHEDYVSYLQTLRRTKSRKKVALLDVNRDNLCLDLVAMKIEALAPNDVEFQADNKIQLIKEFCMLTELFRNQTNSSNLVGFPLPIEFGYLGNQRMPKDLRKVRIFDKLGRPSNYKETYFGAQAILNVTPSDVTCFSYMTMELVGPNLDEWKTFFQSAHSSFSGELVFSVQTTLKLMDQVLCRLLIMHQRNMVHLDLKPDNICMGIGKMTNTVYLLDYGMSRYCSDDKPTITMGSRRYMSVGVLNFEPANYIMDIESWFYVLLVLLGDFVPWSDNLLLQESLDGSPQFEGEEEKILLMGQLKRKFWDDEGLNDTKLIHQTISHIESYHKTDVPDIDTIIWDIYAHVKRMRADFYGVAALRMHSDIRNEESVLYKRYHTLRKLLLFPYDCDFSERESCFYKDKDLMRKQEKRRRLRYDMLVFAEHGQNWQWDWDVWYDEDYVQKEQLASEQLEGLEFSSLHNTKRNNSMARHVKTCVKADGDESGEEEEEEEDEEPKPEPVGIPDWMKHYLARILGGSTTPTQSSSRHHSEPNRVLVA